MRRRTTVVMMMGMALAAGRAAAEEGPGLGEIMGVIQQHHAKLYLAGQAANWPLAAHQADEIGEGFEDAGKFHTHFKDVKEPLPDLIKRYVHTPLEKVAGAVAKKDKVAFSKAFDELTEGCNQCHAQAQHGFIVIQTPQGHEFSNQKFTP